MNVVFPDRCTAQVWGQGGWRWRQCRFKVKVEHDSKGYCTIHDPDRVKAKEKARKEKWEREDKAARKQRAFGWIGPRALKALQRLHEAKVIGGLDLYDGDDEVQEILRIAREQGWSYGK